MIAVLRRPWTRFLCWHGRKHRRVVVYPNGADYYCGKCWIKHAGIYCHDEKEGQ